MPVSEGVFNLFVVDPARVDTRLMLYKMKLTTTAGRVLYFSGFKTVARDTVQQAWPDLSTLYITVRDGADAYLFRHLLHDYDDDDPAIATLDGWATVLDVLSFYQERIANEGYLRTATERRSILEMARSIGYELRPGVAAGTFLAFTLETAQGAPLSASSTITEEPSRQQRIPSQVQIAPWPCSHLRKSQS